MEKNKAVYGGGRVLDGAEGWWEDISEQRPKRTKE
jgi:hypothetical protein